MAGQKDEGQKKSVLEDKTEFGKDEAKEKISHMGDKPASQQKPSGKPSKK